MGSQKIQSNMKVTAMNGQTLADIAVQVYGTIEAMPVIANSNGISMSDDLATGQIIECPDKVFDQYLQDYVRNNNIKPATKQ